MVGRCGEEARRIDARVQVQGHGQGSFNYSVLYRLYPPKPLPANEIEKNNSETARVQKVPMSPNFQGGDVGLGRVTGLSDIPESWPTLPANASLSAEIGWVQAERLRIVEERGISTVVRLEKARSPAPSWSALSWLETSIRSYAKYVEVAAKAALTSTDEAAHVRREEMAIEEIRELLREMRDAKDD